MLKRLISIMTAAFIALTAMGGACISAAAADISWSINKCDGFSTNEVVLTGATAEPATLNGEKCTLLSAPNVTNFRMTFTVPPEHGDKVTTSSISFFPNDTIRQIYFKTGGDADLSGWLALSNPVFKQGEWNTVTVVSDPATTKSDVYINGKGIAPKPISVKDRSVRICFYAENSSPDTFVYVDNVALCGGALTLPAITSDTLSISGQSIGVTNGMTVSGVKNVLTLADEAYTALVTKLDGTPVEESDVVADDMKLTIWANTAEGVDSPFVAQYYFEVMADIPWSSVQCDGFAAGVNNGKAVKTELDGEQCSLVTSNVGVTGGNFYLRQVVPEAYRNQSVTFSISFIPPGNEIAQMYFATGGNAPLSGWKNLSSAAFKEGEWNTLTLVADKEADKRYVYINGALNETLPGYNVASGDLRLIMYLSSAATADTKIYMDNWSICGGALPPGFTSKSEKIWRDYNGLYLRGCEGMTAAEVRDDLVFENSAYTTAITEKGVVVNGDAKVTDDMLLTIWANAPEGVSNPFIAQYPLALPKFTIDDSDKTTITVKTKIDFGDIMMAAYDIDGRLLRAVVSGEKETSAEISTEDAKTIKAFLFESLESINPLMTAVDINVTE